MTMQTYTQELAEKHIADKLKILLEKVKQDGKDDKSVPKSVEVISKSLADTLSEKEYDRFPASREKAMLLWPAMMKEARDGNFPLTLEQGFDIWKNVKEKLREAEKPKDTKTKAINFGKLLLNVLLPPIAIVRQFSNARSVDDEKKILKMGTSVIPGTAMVATYAGLGVAGLCFAMKFYNPLMQTAALGGLTSMAALPVWQLSLAAFGLCILGRAVGTMLGQIIFRTGNAETLNQNADTKKILSWSNMLLKSLKLGVLGSSSKGINNKIETMHEIIADVEYTLMNKTSGTGGFTQNFSIAFAKGQRAIIEKLEKENTHLKQVQNKNSGNPLLLERKDKSESTETVPTSPSQAMLAGQAFSQITPLSQTPRVTETLVVVPKDTTPTATP